MSSVLHDTEEREEARQQRTEEEIQSPYPYRSSCQKEVSESLKINSKVNKAQEASKASTRKLF